MRETTNNFNNIFGNPWSLTTWSTDSIYHTLKVSMHDRLYNLQSELPVYFLGTTVWFLCTETKRCRLPKSLTLCLQFCWLFICPALRNCEGRCRANLWKVSYRLRKAVALRKWSDIKLCWFRCCLGSGVCRACKFGISGRRACRITRILGLARLRVEEMRKNRRISTWKWSKRTIFRSWIPRLNDFCSENVG